MGDEETEVSVADVYCVVYVLKEAKWHHQEGGWSQVILYRDKLDGSHRVVGFTLPDYEVVINCNIGATSKYTKKSADFHKLVDEDGENATVYGFGFSEKALAESDHFMKCVLDVINQDGGPSPSKTSSSSPSAAASPSSSPSSDSASSAGPPQPGGGTSAGDKGALSPPTDRSAPAPLTHAASVGDVLELDMSHRGQAASEAFDEIFDKEKNMVKLGKLKILPPRKPRTPMETGGGGGGGMRAMMSKKGKGQISTASSVTHTTHVKFDAKTRTFEGLPPEWVEALNKQFGVDFTMLDRTKVEGYESKLPVILQTMKSYLIEHDGLEIEGVFRLAPDAEECQLVKRQLNKGEFTTCQDVHCISNLIKVWFRDLPVSVLEGVSAEEITNCSNPEQAGNIVNGVKEPVRSLIQWILDLCILVSDKSSVNKMTPQNLAIVIGPNLFSPKGDANPMEILKFSQKVARWLEQAILWRKEALSK